MDALTRSDGDPRASYRERLALLADGRAVEAVLEKWAAEQQADSGGGWQRIYGKLRPRRSPWALLVFQAGTGLTVAARLLEHPDDTAPSASGAARSAGPLGWVELLPCTEDPALPGLPDVLAALASPRVVRYHPGNRCTVRGGSGQEGRFVKVFSDEVDDQEEARLRWEASMAGTLSFAVAEPHGWREESRSSWYGVVPGELLGVRLRNADGAEGAAGAAGAVGADLVRRVGRSLGELAVAPLEPRRVDDQAHQLKRTARGLARAGAVAPALEARLARVLEALTQVHEGLGPRPLVPIHGAAHLGQWLVDENGRLGLVDFDRFARGEPEFDLATFLVELAAASRGAPTEPLQAAVVEGFREVAGPVDEQRLAVYLVHKRLARVVRAAAGLRPDGEERATRELEQVEGLLHPLL